jgi:hypothetical protein
MVTLARRAARIPFAPVVAILFGIVAAILVAAVPQWLFERGIVASGLPAVIAASAPPLGLMARLLAIAIAFLAITVLLWAVLGPLTAKLEGRARARTPWRDAGYDTPLAEDNDLFIAPRRPIFAPEELGAPLMSDEAIATVPESEPETVPEETPELAAPVVFEELAQEPLVSPSTDNSIAALIRRLEDGLARRAASDPDPSAPTGAPHPGTMLDDATPVSSDMPVGDDEDAVRQALGMFKRMARG